MSRLSLLPQRREFFQLYSRASANVVEIGSALVEFLDTFPMDSDNRVQKIRELEHEGDRLTHEVVDNLNRTFVTPFDRDDMYRLAGALDDICDHVDDAAEKITGYGVREIRSQATEQAKVIHRSANKLREAIAQLEGFKDSQRQLIELPEREEQSA